PGRRRSCRLGPAARSPPEGAPAPRPTWPLSRRGPAGAGSPSSRRREVALVHHVGCGEPQNADGRGALDLHEQEVARSPVLVADVELLAVERDVVVAAELDPVVDASRGR